MPQRVGKYSSYDIESRQLLTQALEQAGSAPYIVIPKESEVRPPIIPVVEIRVRHTMTFAKPALKKRSLPY